MYVYDQGALTRHECPEPYDQTTAEMLAYAAIATGMVVSNTQKARVRLALEGPYGEMGPWSRG